jgi:uncharacterized membrane protein (DUF106 family)
MKALRERLKQHQKEMKEQKSNPQKMMEINKKAMEANMEYMRHSFKATLFTIIPVIILFGWLNLHMAYYPLMPGQPFTVDALFKSGVTGTVGLEGPAGLTFLSNKTQNIVDSKAGWTLQGPAGDYTLDVKYSNKTFPHEIIITSERTYTPVEQSVKDTMLTTIKVNNEKITYLNIFGWKIGWLGSYIIFSIIVSSLLRKVLKIY